MSRLLINLLARCRTTALTGAVQPTDTELLARFVQARDAAAFELLFWRHGPMVWGVCRRVLGDTPDAEDAFQATFVVLTRKAASVGRGDALAAWLHRVAWRTALNARTARRRREVRERPAPDLAECSGHDDPARGVVDRETRDLLDRELAGLPEKFRLPVILCDLEARSNEAAAAVLHCPVGTLCSRLSRGRRKLRERLLRRGLAPAALTVVAVPPAVSAAALAAVLHGPSRPVQALAGGTIRSLMLATVKRVTAGVLLGSALMASLAFAALPGRDDPAPPAPQARPEPGPRLLDPDAGPLPAGALARIGSQRLRHAGDVTGLTYSPDGKWLASVSTSPADATARVWDAVTGKEQLRVPVTLPGQLRSSPAQVPRAVGFSADARQFLVIDPAALRSFDLATGKERFGHPIANAAPSAGNGPSLIGAGLAPDGKAFVLAWDDRRVEIRDIATGAVRKTAEHPFKDYGFVSIEFSTDSRRFVVSADSQAVFAVFDTASGSKVADVRVEGRQVVQVRFLPGGERLAVLLTDEHDTFKRVIGFYELQGAKLVRTADVDKTTYAIAVSSDGRLIFAGNGQKEFSQLLDVETGKEVGRVRSTPSLMTLAFAPDGKRVAGARPYSGAISVWDTTTLRFDPIAAEPTGFYGATFAPDSQALILTRGDHAFVDWRTGTVTRRLAELKPDGLAPQALSPDTRLFALATRKGPIQLFNAASGKELRTLTGPTNSAGSLTFSADSRRLACCDWDKVIRVWDVATGKELARFTAPELFGADTLVLSHEGRVLAVTCHQKITQGSIVITWDVDDRTQLARIEAPSWFFSPVALSPDGRLVAGGGGKYRQEATTESPVTVWDASTGQVLHTLPGHANQNVHPGASCAFSPDGWLLATGDSAGQLRLWEVVSGQEVHHFEGHRSPVLASFSPDGRLLAAASEDAPCFIWDVTGHAKRPGPADNVDAEKLWTDLAAPDAKAAFEAVRRLASSPGPAVAMLRGRLRPAAALDRATVDRLLRDLDAETFADRETATAELVRLADRIDARLRAARTTASAEAHRRLDDILEKAAKPSSARLREGRALLALEWIATPEAVQLLAVLARGAPDDSLTIAAAAARRRLEQRVGG